MRVIVNVVDSTIVVDGVGRKVNLPPSSSLQHLSWDGLVGVMVFDEGDPVYFDGEDEVEPYLSAWETAPAPEPPPLPPWEDETPLPLPTNAIPVPWPEPFPVPEPPIPWDGPWPEGFVPLVGPWAATEEEIAEALAKLAEKKR